LKRPLNGWLTTEHTTLILDYCLQACSWSYEECIAENESKNNELQGINRCLFCFFLFSYVT